MAKGNHVFNHYNKTIENAFAAFIDAARIHTAQGAKINLATAKAASGSADAVALAGKLPKAWPKFKEIVTAPAFARWDTMQDDEPVLPNDPNSAAYGKVGKSFIDEVVKIASQGTRPGARPGAHWQEMINIGFDQAAATGFIGQGNKAGERRALVESTQTWVRGPLNGLVSTWIQYMKLDMDGKK